MSKLAKEVFADSYSTRVTVATSLLSDILTVNETIDQISPIFREYSISANFRCRTVLPENDSDALEYAVKMAKRSIVEAVFGEFREDFYKIHNALQEQNLHKAQKLLHNMQYRMFEEIE